MVAQQQGVETFDLNNADWLALPPNQSGGGDFVVPDEDMYVMTFEVLPEKRLKPPFQGKVQDNPPTQVRILLRIVQPESEFDGCNWKQWMTLSWDDRSFMYKLIMAIRNNVPLGDGEPADPRRYVGKYFRGMVKVREFTKDNGEIGRWPYVDGMLPIQRRAAARAATPVAEPDASEALDAREAIAHAAASGTEAPW